MKTDADFFGTDDFFVRSVPNETPRRMGQWTPPTKPPTTESTAEINRSSGFHLFEIHIATMGMSMISTLLLIVFLAIAAYFVYRCIRCCRGPPAFPRQQLNFADMEQLAMRHLAMRPPAIVWQQPSPRIVELPPTPRRTGSPAPPARPDGAAASTNEGHGHFNF